MKSRTKKAPAQTISQIRDLRDLDSQSLLLPTTDLLINFPDLLTPDSEELGKRCIVISTPMLNIYTAFSKEKTQLGEISAEIIHTLEAIEEDGIYSEFTAKGGDTFDAYTLGKVTIIKDLMKHEYTVTEDESIAKKEFTQTMAQAEYWCEHCPKNKFRKGARLVTNDEALSLFLSQAQRERYNFTALDPSISNNYYILPADECAELYARWLNERNSVDRTSGLKGIPEKVFLSLLPENAPRPKPNQYYIFGNDFDPKGTNICFYNSEQKIFEPIICDQFLTSPKSAEQAIAFDALIRAKANVDASPYVAIAGEQGTGKTFTSVVYMLSMVPQFKRIVMRTDNDVAQLTDEEQPRVKPDGTTTQPRRKKQKANNKSMPCYNQGKKKKSGNEAYDYAGDSELYSKSTFSRVLVVVPDKQMGAKSETLPGDRMAKFAPKVAAFKELIVQTIMQARKTAGLRCSESLAYSLADEIIHQIEFVTMGELSSRSPINTLIIVDEAQFHTSAQLRLAVGRPAEGSVLVFLADPYQITNRFSANGNPFAILMRRICGKLPFFSIVVKKVLRNGPKTMKGVRI